MFECHICNKNFKNKNALSGHIHKHNIIKCSSILTKKEINVKNLFKHDDAYLKRIKLCPVCNIKHMNPKYCSHSCRAIEVNSNRTLSETTKQKIALTNRLKSNNWPYSKVTFRECKKCSKPFLTKGSGSVTRLYCDTCRNYLASYRDLAVFRFASSEVPELFNDNRIKSNGWYRRSYPNPDAMVFDHLYRVIDGFRNSIPPEIISHPANAELVTMRENRNRHTKSTISLDELYKRIDLFNKGKLFK